MFGSQESWFIVYLETNERKGMHAYARGKVHVQQLIPQVCRNAFHSLMRCEFRLHFASHRTRLSTNRLFRIFRMHFIDNRLIWLARHLFFDDGYLLFNQSYDNDRKWQKRERIKYRIWGNKGHGWSELIIHEWSDVS